MIDAIICHKIISSSPSIRREWIEICLGVYKWASLSTVSLHTEGVD